MRRSNLMDLDTESHWSLEDSNLSLESGDGHDFANVGSGSLKEDSSVVLVRVDASR